MKARCRTHIQLRAHFHNTRNTALANAVAAVEEGVRVLDGSLGGIGGCPFAPGAAGNVPTEDLAYMFARMGFDTGVDLDRAVEAAKFIGGVLGRQDARHGQPRAEMAGYEQAQLCDASRRAWRAVAAGDGVDRWRDVSRLRSRARNTSPNSAPTARRMAGR